jgi:hypothetical protein
MRQNGADPKHRTPINSYSALRVSSCEILIKHSTGPLTTDRLKHAQEKRYSIPRHG